MLRMSRTLAFAFAKSMCRSHSSCRSRKVHTFFFPPSFTLNEKSTSSGIAQHYLCAIKIEGKNRGEEGTTPVTTACPKTEKWKRAIRILTAGEASQKNARDSEADPRRKPSKKRMTVLTSGPFSRSPAAGRPRQRLAEQPQPGPPLASFPQPRLGPAKLRVTKIQVAKITKKSRGTNTN